MRLTMIALAAVTAAAALAPAAGHATTLSPIQEGRRAWLKYNCYGCHGMHGYGTMGPNIAGEGDVTEWIYAGGAQGMPSFRALMTSTDILNMNAYLKSIGTPGEPTFTHWWEAVPSQ